ncbi:hypothetical protein [Candidatus Vidania fulgoroideorum]
MNFILGLCIKSDQIKDIKKSNLEKIILFFKKEEIFIKFKKKNIKVLAKKKEIVEIISYIKKNYGFNSKKIVFFGKIKIKIFFFKKKKKSVKTRNLIFF